MQHAVFIISSRRKAREAALQALYQADSVCEWSQQVIQQYYDFYQGSDIYQNKVPLFEVSKARDSELRQQPDYRAFSKKIATGVIDNLQEIDQGLAMSSTHWPVERMNRVDRNILRIAAFELLHCNDIPQNVTINEAIEIAKRYASNDSANFINGVLDNFAHNLANTGKLDASVLAQSALNNDQTKLAAGF